MADQNAVPNGGGDPRRDDTFEMDLKEILEDGPNLNDMSNTVQSGSPKKTISRSYSGSSVSAASFGSTEPRLTRSFTMPPATSNVPLSSQTPVQSNGDFIPKTVSAAQSKLESIRHWSVNTFKCTKQYLAERLGKGSKTVDLELETQIEVLRDMQRKYANILRLARTLTNHFYQVVQTQRALGEAFGEQGQRSPELHEEFSYNCETQRALVRNGETLLGAMNFFTSSVNTLCNKTMEDSLMTVRQYEHARLEYDAYRNDLEVLQLGPRDGGTVSKIEESKRKFDDYKVKFEQLRADVTIKLKFLDENRVKVMHKQLLLFHNAVSAYFTGNDAALEATLKQFNIKLKGANTEMPSWLEQ
ncbi:arfaptin-2-like isoform X1 [Mizuhopecten yessoensis]|uniref:Arfaptin-1 n=1 Tax=Mizuhopecten yessoensis TaxID=6573 RepID=A0A210QD14_MIZYE|nr:arfaptin-2-like isoform X1 [Mizuhopecten yessoensis]OWF46615.1 Arfaptin-1 [Mizuhopecten yessoensis]